MAHDYCIVERQRKVSLAALKIKKKLEFEAQMRKNMTNGFIFLLESGIFYVGGARV